MRLIDLIEALQDQLAALSGPEQEAAEVRLMTQQSWPFENSVHGVIAASDIEAECYDEEDPDAGEEGYTPCDGPDHLVIYLTEGRQIGYGTKAAW